MVTGENINGKYNLNAAGSDVSVLGIDYGYIRVVDLTHSFSNETLSLVELGYIKNGDAVIVKDMNMGIGWKQKECEKWNPKKCCKGSCKTKTLIKLLHVN